MFDDHAAVQHGDVVAHVQCSIEIMGDEEERKMKTISNLK